MKLVKRPFKQNARIHIEIVPKKNGEFWVEITFLKSRKWRPALEELDAIIRAIGACEDKKYPNGRGRFYTLDFLQDALWNVTSFETLKEKYLIPIKLNSDYDETT